MGTLTARLIADRVSIATMSHDSPNSELNPSDLLSAIRKRGPRGLTVQQLVNQVAAERKLGRSEVRHLLRPVLKSLQRDGLLVLGRGKRYFVPEASDLLTGRLRRAARGQIEVVMEGTHETPVRVPPQGIRGALEGDTVLVILDSCHTKAHVAAELEAYHHLVTPGSYIVATDGSMQDLWDVPRGDSTWKDDHPSAAAREFAATHPEFQLEQPAWPFNESALTENITHWPDAFLRRTG